MPLDWPILLALFAVALVAGFVDAIAGGGGLLTVPSLLLAGLPAPLALGTNKAQGVFGTAVSLSRFAASPLLDRRRAAQSFLPALAGAALGVGLISAVPERLLRPLVMALLATVAVFMVAHRGPPDDPDRPSRRRSWALAATVAATIAFYDGFFGPGTGTFLIMAYIWLWHDTPDRASANAKVVNFASNLAAMVTFAAKGMIVWKFAAPMALGQALGGYLGARLTIRIGRTLVRYAVIVVSIALLARLAWPMLRGWLG